MEINIADYLRGLLSSPTTFAVAPNPAVPSFKYSEFVTEKDENGDSHFCCRIIKTQNGEETVVVEAKMGRYPHTSMEDCRERLLMQIVMRGIIGPSTTEL